MAASLSTQLEALEAERERLEELLMLDANWRALRQLDEREAAGQPLLAVDGAELKAGLSRALAGNRVYVARAKLLETIELLSADFPGRSAGLEGGPLSSRIVMLSEPTGDTFRARLRLKPETGAGPVVGGPKFVEKECRAGSEHRTDTAVDNPVGDKPSLSSMSSRGTAVAVPSVPAGPVASAPVTEAVSAPETPDPLELIDGLGRCAVELLIDGGVTKFAEIAQWSGVDVATWRARLDGVTQGSAGGWIEQAAMLATGRSTHFAERARRGEFGALVPAPQPEPPRPWATADAADAACSLALGSVAAQRVPPSLPDISRNAERNARCVTADELARVLDRPGMRPPPLPGVAMAATDANAGPQGYVRPIRDRAPGPPRDEQAIVAVEALPDVAEAAPVEVSPSRIGARPRTLLRRMKTLHQSGRFEADAYAAYRGSVEEASVTILAASEPKPEAAPPAKSADGTVLRPANRFLKALTGKT